MKNAVIINSEGIGVEGIVYCVQCNKKMLVDDVSLDYMCNDCVFRS